MTKEDNKNGKRKSIPPEDTLNNDLKQIGMNKRKASMMNKNESVEFPNFFNSTSTQRLHKIVTNLGNTQDLKQSGRIFKSTEKSETKSKVTSPTAQASLGASLGTTGVSYFDESQNAKVKVNHKRKISREDIKYYQNTKSYNRLVENEEANFEVPE